MATQTTNLIQNGDFGIGSAGNWANWQSSGAFDTTGGGDNAPTHIADESANTLTYSGLDGLDVGPGGNGAGQLSLDIGWNDGTPVASSSSNTMASTSRALWWIRSLSPTT